MTKTDFSAWASGPPSWITSHGNDFNGTVLSSRVRLARNFLGVPFPHHASVAQQKKSLENSLETLKSCALINRQTSFHLAQLPRLERLFLMERQLISHEHAGKDGEAGLVVSAGENISVMINEEDHLRQACFRPGLGLVDAWETLTELDDAIGARLPLSYDATLGYVTACPTNMGTGLRASCLLHLPALVLTGRIQSVISELTGSALHARGFYGEGTTAFGDLFQISNVKTLGQTEAHLIRDVEHAIKEICALEKREEENLMSVEFRLKTEDLIYRAFGTLRSARALNFVEGMKYVSLVRLGLKLGKDLPVKLDEATSFFFLAQPGHLQMKSVRTRQTLPDEVLRADFFRGALKNL